MTKFSKLITENTMKTIEIGFSPKISFIKFSSPIEETSSCSTFHLKNTP